MPRPNLKVMRLDRGLTLQAAAKEMGIDRQVLSNAENGSTTPRADTAFKIADFYGYRVTQIWPVADPEKEAA